MERPGWQLGSNTGHKLEAGEHDENRDVTARPPIGSPCPTGLIPQLVDGLMAHSDVAVYARTLDGEFLMANQCSAPMHGRADGHLVGRHTSDVLPGPVAADLMANDRDVVVRGRPRLFAERTPHPDGTEHCYLSTKFPVRDATGAVVGVGGISTDVTELAEARRALAASELRWRALVERVPVAVGVCDMRTLRLQYANPHTGAILGLEPGELNGRCLSELLEPATYKRLRRLLQRAERGEPCTEATLCISRGDGATRDVELSAVTLTDDEHPAVLFTLHDVTSANALQAELREGAAFHDAVLAASPDIIYILDAVTHRPVWSSSNLFHTLGYTEMQLVAMGPRRIAELVHPDDAAQLQAANQHCLQLADRQAASQRYRLLDATGNYRWLARRITPFSRDDAGNVTHVLAVARDITDLVEAEERRTHYLLHDPLTGLPNRRLLADRLTTALHRGTRNGGQTAVFHCDLDDFTKLNDRYGHDVGDAVLLEVAQRLRTQARPHDTIARIGADEFVVIFEPVPAPADRVPLRQHRRDPSLTALALANRIRMALAQPFAVDGVEVTVEASIGLTFAEADETAEDVLRAADSAKRQAKILGGNRCEVFDEQLRCEIADRLSIERLLREALDLTPDPGGPSTRESRPSARLWVAYQPIVGRVDRRIVGLEALARLADPDGHFIPPDTFIPIAEETGLIRPLGKFVLEQACRDLASWDGLRLAGHRLGMSVNVSALQLGSDHLVEHVGAVLQANQLDPDRLTLELTESALLQAGDQSISQLRHLRALGVRIAIDDFGTGYASLKYLTQLPVTGLKVDRSFTAGLPGDPASNAIVQSVASLARSLDLTCVVEGIQTPEQLISLPLEVHIQGFLLGTPRSAADIPGLFQPESTAAIAVGRSVQQPRRPMILAAANRR